ncbi:MAG: methyl-accepting chemotaxis protein [Zymomonas mobilis subsp. pomaceae]|uniref:methyl-accepting chemotaxis protein n=1 Tax=Zymomonas mobilis TaxID=542 RepID=UPI0039E8AEFF
MGLSNLTKNLKISAKIYLILAIPLFFLCSSGMGAFIIQLKLSDIGQDLGIRQRIHLQLTGDISRAVADYRSAETRMVMTNDPIIEQAAKKEIDVYQAEVQDLAQQLNNAQLPPSMLIKNQQFLSDWQRYIDLSRQTIGAVIENHKADAHPLFWKELPLFDQISDELKTIRHIQGQIIEAKVNDMKAFFVVVRWLIILTTLLAVLLSIFVAGLIVKVTVKPLQMVTHALHALAGGNTNVNVPVEKRSDEIGELITTFILFRERILNAEKEKEAQLNLLVSDIGDALHGLSKSDLTVRITGHLTGGFSKIKEDFNYSIGVLNDVVSKIIQSAENIKTGADEIQQASNDLSLRTEQQAASLEETSAVMVQISNTVDHTAEGANASKLITDQVETEVVQSSHVVQQAMEAMNRIENGSKKIAQIIGVIDGIAFQTNLLALNAGVEAARAGEAGKGFSVVAAEVRALAQRSAEAAKDVKERITDSAREVENGVLLVNKTGDTLTQIVQQIHEISERVTQSAEMAEQQASGLRQVNTAVSEMDSVTQKNAAMVQQSTKAVSQLAIEAQNMMQQMQQFKLAH